MNATIRRVAGGCYSDVVERGSGRLTGSPRVRRGGLGVIAIAVAFALTPTSAQAATISVSTTAALEAAVEGASAGDVVVLSAGTYAPESTLQIRRDLTIRGPSVTPGATILGANLAPGTSPDLIAVDAGVTARLGDVTLRQTGPDGAAVNAFGTVEVDHATISTNAGFGVVAQGGARLTMVNTTVTDNQDMGVIAQPGADVTLTNVTVASNRRGVYNELGSRVSVRNAILANPGGDCLNPVQASVASIERSGGGCSLNIQADTVVERPADNGGPSVTRALIPGSPAIDAGDPATCPADDQRYASRIGPCDIGAFESGGTPGTVAAPPLRGVDLTLPACARTIRTQGRQARVDVVARGWIGRTRDRGARFAVTIRAGKGVRRGTYSDRRAKIALRLSVLSVTPRPGRRQVQLRGVSEDVKGGRQRCFTIELRDGRPDRFSIRLSSGYRRSGVVRSGPVRIGPVKRSPSSPFAVRTEPRS